MSDSFGRALMKVGGSSQSTGLAESRHDNTLSQRRFEYEDGIIVRSVEAREQISRMAQPFVFTRDQLAEQHIVTLDDPNDSAQLILKDIRNRITLARPGLGATTLVTSVGKSEQSSIFARNLAAIMAGDENRTSLLMEAQPSKAKLFGDVDNPIGLADYIGKDDCQVATIIHPTGIPRMRVIPFGSYEFMGYEYLRSTQMRILVKDVTRRYPRERFLVIDAPPVDQVADVELLNEYADFIVLFIPYGQVSEAKIKASLTKLDNEKLIGVVMGGAPRSTGIMSRLTK
ncbi:MAG: hypothetical protein ACWA44_14710 [Thiotrichales bacterium]